MMEEFSHFFITSPCKRHTTPDLSSPFMNLTMKTFCLLLGFFILSILCGATSSSKYVAFAPRRSPAILHSVTSIPRGGAGPLDPELTAKVITSTVAAQGLASSFLPNFSCEMYGYDPSPLNRYQMRIIGAFITETALLLSLRLWYPDLSIMQSLGYVYVVGTLIALLSTMEQSKEMGTGSSGSFFICFLGAGTCYKTKDKDDDCWMSSVVAVILN